MLICCCRVATLELKQRRGEKLLGACSGRFSFGPTCQSVLQKLPLVPLPGGKDCGAKPKVVGGIFCPDIIFKENLRNNPYKNLFLNLTF
jgi:hypothetical protein